MFIILYVDDMIVAARNLVTVESVIKGLQRCFELSCAGHDRSANPPSSEPLCVRILERRGLATGNSSPVAWLPKTEITANWKTFAKYVICQTGRKRPDIAFTTSYLRGANSAPKEIHSRLVLQADLDFFPRELLRAR